MFRACITHWLELNPPPDPAAWAAFTDPLQRGQRALTAFYRYYRSGERTWTRAYRDRVDVAALQVPMAELEGFLREVRDELAAGWEPKDKVGVRLIATIGHGLRFPTWQSLSQENKDDFALADLVRGWVACILQQNEVTSDSRDWGIRRSPLASDPQMSSGGGEVGDIVTADRVKIRGNAASYFVGAIR